MPQDSFIFIRICDFLGGIGLIVPAMAGVKLSVTLTAPHHVLTLRFCLLNSMSERLLRVQFSAGLAPAVSLGKNVPLRLRCWWRTHSIRAPARQCAN